MPRSLLAVAVLVTLARSAPAETFVFKNGARAEGTVKSVGTDTIDVGVGSETKTIRKDSLERIEFEPSRAATEMTPGERLLIVGFGTAVPTAHSHLNEIARPGLASTLAAIIQVTPRLGLGLQLDSPGFNTVYNQSEFADRKGQVSGAGFEFVARGVALPKSKYSPIGLLGVGFNGYTQHVEYRPKPGAKWGDTGTSEMREVEDDSSGLALVAGAGMQALLSDRYLATLEARWNYWTVDHEKFGANVAEMVTFLATLGWRF